MSSVPRSPQSEVSVEMGEVSPSTVGYQSIESTSPESQIQSLPATITPSSNEESPISHRTRSQTKKKTFI